MENQINETIQVRLDSVSEMGFTTNPTLLEDEACDMEIQLGFSSTIEPDTVNDKLTLHFGVRYSVNVGVVLESVYKFVFSVVSLSQFIHIKDDTITVSHIMPHLLGVAVGTMRGVLVVKTAGSSLARFPLPMIDINHLNEMLSSEE